jgi:glycosyltransferase involved in cell wall biosynthesis
MSAGISVVVPTFNRASLIKDTLDSILRQTLPPAEVIVVDDGSTDSTEATVAEYGSTVRYHRIENAGPSRARNVGALLTTQHWIAFCDSDDLWMPTKLERQMRIHTEFPDVDYSFTNFTIVDSGRWLPGSKFNEADPNFWGSPSRRLDQTIWIYDTPLLERILRFQPIFVSTLVLTRDRYEVLHGYDERFSRALAEDFEFTLRNAMRPPIGVLAEPLVGIRRHPGNNSGYFLGVLLGEIEILEYALATYGNAGAFRHLFEDQIEWRRSLAVDQAFAAGRLDMVRDLASGLGASYSNWRVRTKINIANLPAPLARTARRVLVAAGTGLSQIRHSSGSAR